MIQNLLLGLSDNNNKKYSGLINKFKLFFQDPEYKKKILIFYGVGNSGKTSLIYLFKFLYPVGNLPADFLYGNYNYNIPDNPKIWYIRDIDITKIKLEAIKYLISKYSAKIIIETCSPILLDPELFYKSEIIEFDNQIKNTNYNLNLLTYWKELADILE